MYKTCKREHSSKALRQAKNEAQAQALKVEELQEELRVLRSSRINELSREGSDHERMRDMMAKLTAEHEDQMAQLVARLNRENQGKASEKVHLTSRIEDLESQLEAAHRVSSSLREDLAESRSHLSRARSEHAAELQATMDEMTEMQERQAEQLKTMSKRHEENETDLDTHLQALRTRHATEIDRLEAEKLNLQVGIAA